MSIKVTREGRENVYLVSKEEIIKYIKEKKLERIHNFAGGGNMIIGADHDVKSVIENINRSERIAILIGNASNMGHSLAVIIDNRLECYDIGEVEENDLEIIEND